MRIEGYRNLIERILAMALLVSLRAVRPNFLAEPSKISTMVFERVAGFILRAVRRKLALARVDILRRFFFAIGLILGLGFKLDGSRD